MKKRTMLPPVFYLVFLSGMAALSWEVVWQLKSSLALGVSAWGTALTLAITMGGMSAGAFIMGAILKRRTVKTPLRIYAGLEALIGLSGLCLIPAFAILEKLDAAFYDLLPQSAVIVHLLGIVATLGIPATAMGATLPVLGLIGKQTGTSIAVLYGLNTLGAAAGTLIAAFTLIPLLGMNGTAMAIAALNMTVGIAAWSLKPGENKDAGEQKTTQERLCPPLPFRPAALLVFATGFATFALEVAWFRSLSSAFMSTTDAFAIMLSCVLLALGLGPSFVPALKKSKSLGIIVVCAGILILLATPIIERFDLFVKIEGTSPALLLLQWFILSLWIIGPPVLLLGIAVPWILDDQNTPRKWGIFYGINTLSSILGSLAAGWILLPLLGFAATAWLAGLLVIVTGLSTVPKKARSKLVGTAAIALLIAVHFQSGVGKTRALGSDRFLKGKESRILETYEGPDATLTALEWDNVNRLLFINGFIATQQATDDDMKDHIHYMPWMGHLPMASVPAPKQALVICFGTGQTANAVRQNNPEELDIVDVNPHIFDLADNFPANQNVLGDPRVTAIAMDGRAWLRRTRRTYDVITLEPMPPGFAGTNALYSREFYELARARLKQDGAIAQWLPFHLVSHKDSMAIAKTFQTVFPNAVLWLDPPSRTGILLGTVNEDRNLATSWPGYNRTPVPYDLNKKEVENAVLMNREQLMEYASAGTLITDDNQYLAYGESVHALRNSTIRGQHHEILQRLKEVQ